MAVWKEKVCAMKFRHITNVSTHKAHTPNQRAVGSSSQFVV